MGTGKNKLACVGDEPGAVVIHPALRGYFTYRFYKTAVRLRAQVNAALEQHGLVGPELGILRVLEVTGPVSQVDLGRSLGIDKATMVKMLDNLERLGLLRREGAPGDRRVKEIHLTREGKATLKAGGRLREKVEKEFFAPISASERAQLEKILDKLLG